MKKPKVLVLGASGMLGRTVYLYLRKKHAGIFGTSRNKNRDFIYFNFEKTQLETLLDNNKFDYLVNCIAQIPGDSKDYSINSRLPKLIEHFSKSYNFKIINISTDAVFSENASEVNEKTKPDPKDEYGKSKFRGETKQNTLNIRTSIIGLDPNGNKGLLEFYIKNKKNKIEGFENQIWSGATTLQVAKFIEWLVYRYKFDILKLKTDVIHFAPLGPISKYEILRSFASYFGFNNVVRNDGKSVSRWLSTIFFDDIKLTKYNNELDAAIAELFEFDKDYARKIKKT